MATRTCAADDCKEQFEPTDWRQIYHSSRCASRMRVRRLRAKSRKGGGGGGNGGGGGESSTLFETLTPVDSRAIYVPDTRYRTPDQEPTRKPSVSVSPKAHKAAA